jgi:hemolysin-activating ACP:hemolysin acyltransferase
MALVPNLAAAVITWARVSDEVDRRLATTTEPNKRLKPEEWISGPKLWLIDAVGQPASVASALHVLNAGPLKDKAVFMSAVDEAGSSKTLSLSDIIARAASIQGVP